MSKFTYYTLFLTFITIKLVNSHCFTMPPKITPINTWSISIPNINSPEYLHITHECPIGYKTKSKHSHIESLVSNSILNIQTSTISIYSYAVCCTTNWEQINDENYCSKKYKEIQHKTDDIYYKPNEMNGKNETNEKNYTHYTNYV